MNVSREYNIWFYQFYAIVTLKKNDIKVTTGISTNRYSLIQLTGMHKLRGQENAWWEVLVMVE